MKFPVSDAEVTVTVEPLGRSVVPTTYLVDELPAGTLTVQWSVFGPGPAGPLGASRTLRVPRNHF